MSIINHFREKRINFGKSSVHCGKLFNIFAKIVFESKNKMYFCAIRNCALLKVYFHKHTN